MLTLKHSIWPPKIGTTCSAWPVDIFENLQFTFFGIKFYPENGKLQMTSLKTLEFWAPKQAQHPMLTVALLSCFTPLKIGQADFDPCK